MKIRSDIATFEALEPRQLFSADAAAPALPAEALPGGTDPGQIEVGAAYWRMDRVAYDGILDARASRRMTYVDYMLCDEWGGTVADAEKSPTTDEDDLMCWAASASNVLEWTGWGLVDGMTNTDEMFAYYQDHWTNEGGLPFHAWEWWFSDTFGANPPAEHAQVDVEGGGFYPDERFRDYHHSEYVPAWALSGIDEFLHSGYGVNLFITTEAGGGHLLTCWGVRTDIDDPTDYLGVWVTDSDDDQDSTRPRDRLRYYRVTLEGGDWGRWHLRNFHGSDDWQISTVYGLAPRPVELPPFDPYGRLPWDDPIGSKSPMGDPFGSSAAKASAVPEAGVKTFAMNATSPAHRGALTGVALASKTRFAPASRAGASPNRPAPARSHVLSSAGGPGLDSFPQRLLRPLLR